jgi:hypothetical protein
LEAGLSLLVLPSRAGSLADFSFSSGSMFLFNSRDGEGSALARMRRAG